MLLLPRIYVVDFCGEGGGGMTRTPATLHYTPYTLSRGVLGDGIGRQLHVTDHTIVQDKAHSLPAVKIEKRAMETQHTTITLLTL